MSIDTQNITAAPGNIKNDVNAIKNLGHLQRDTEAGAHLFNKMGHGAETHPQPHGKKPDITPAQPSGTEKTLNNVGAVGNKLWNYEFFGGMAGGAIATKAAAGGMSRISTVLHAVFIAPFKALRATPLNKLFQLPANYMKSVRDQALDAGKKTQLRTHSKALDGIFKKPGRWKRFKNYLTGEKFTAVELHPELKSFSEYLEKAKLGSKEELVGHLDNAKEALSAAEKSMTEKLGGNALQGAEKQSLEALQSQIGEINGALAKAGTNSESWVLGLNEATRKTQLSGMKLGKKVNEIVSPVTDAAGERITNGLNQFSKTSIGSQVEAGAVKLSDWSSNTFGTTLEHSRAKAADALITDVPGFWQRQWNMITFKKPGKVELHPDLHKVSQHLDLAKGEDALLHLTNAKKELVSVAEKTSAQLGQKGLEKAEKSALQALEAKIGAITQFADKAIHYAETPVVAGEAKTLATMGKSLMRGAGNSKVFGAVVAASTVAAIGAAIVASKHESKEAKQAFDEMAADIGADKHHPLMESITKGFKAQKHGGSLKLGMHAVGEVANGVMAASVHGGGGAVMGAMMLPMVGGMFVKDHVELNAYVNLKKFEKGEITLEPAQQLNFTKQLIAVVPAVANHGGYYNRLVEPVAQAVLDQKLSVKDTMRLLANEEKFSAIAAKALEEQRTTEAKAAAPAVDTSEMKFTKRVEEGRGVADRSLPDRARPAASNDNAAPYLAADKPGKITSSVVHEGTVEQRQKVATV